MLRIPILTLLSLVAALAQEPSTVSKEQPPPDVDQALRERVQQFYDFHVQGQFRKAEQFVADDLKDYFYNISKPKYQSAKLVDVEYSDNFTHADATVFIERYINAPPFPPNVLIKGNIHSTWKLENGKWVWWEDPNAPIATPFGPMKRPAEGTEGRTPGLPGTLPGTPGGIPGVGVPGTVPAIPNTADFILNKVKADKEAVTLKPGASTEVVLTNSAVGSMNITVAKPDGWTVKPESLVLGANSKATLTLEAGKTARAGIVEIHISPTGETVPIRVAVE